MEDKKKRVVRTPHQKENISVRNPKILLLLGLVKALTLIKSIPVMKSKSDKKILQ